MPKPKTNRIYKRALHSLVAAALQLASASSSFADIKLMVLPKCPKVYQFPSYQQLTDKQQELISGYVPNAQSDFTAWATANDGLATEFIANTQALTHFQAYGSHGQIYAGSDLLQSIKEIDGDRIFYNVNVVNFEDWRNAGGKFKLNFANGKTQISKVNFDKGDIGGSLHPGSNMQGYTSVLTVPRIQFNYNSNDHVADIDLDAYQPWIAGFIPDPAHMSWNNSDPRCWISEFENRYGKLAISNKKPKPGQIAEPSPSPAPVVPVIAPVTTTPVAPVPAPVITSPVAPIAAPIVDPAPAPAPAPITPPVPAASIHA